jgi:hypothetical protein
MASLSKWARHRVHARRSRRGWSRNGGLLGQAIDYALKRWSALTPLVEDGFWVIGNNLIEIAIRPSAFEKRIGYSLDIQRRESAAR